MKNVINTLNGATLKAIASAIKLDGRSKMSTQELRDALEVYINDLGVIAKYNRLDWEFCSFGTQYAEVEDIQNNAILPIGAVIAHPINQFSGFLCNEHYNLLLADKLDLADDCVGINLSADAKVFVVDSEFDLKILYAICGTFDNALTLDFNKAIEEVDTDIVATHFLNYESASEHFDAILFTKNAVNELSWINDVRNLHGVDTETLVILNNAAIEKQAYFAMIDINGSLLSSIIDVKKEANRAERVVKTQYRIRQTSIDDLVWEPIMNRFVLPANLDMDARTIPMSENRLFRWYHETKTEVIDGIEVEKRFVPDFTIFNAVSAINTPEAVEKIKAVIINGYVDLTPHMVTGVSDYKREVRVCLQSASQARTGKFYFTALDRDEVRTNLVYGTEFGDQVQISKMEARIGLAVSSANMIADGIKANFTSKVIADRSYTAERTVIQFNGSKVVRVKKDITLTPTDGQGTIEVLPSARIAQTLGLISVRELDYFTTNYTDLNSLRSNSKLMRIFKKVPNAFQVRHAGDKGLLIMYPHSEYGYTEEVVMCKSMHKYAPEASEIEWEICNWNKAKKDFVYLSYQFIQSLNITAEDLISLAQDTIDKVDLAVMTDPNVAMKFLGMIYNVGDESEADEDILVSKVTKILAEDGSMINDKKVQNSLKKLLEKFFIELSLGRIPVEGSYDYIACDPRFMLGDDNCLQANENYFNNKTGHHVCMRSPMIHSSEVTKLNMIEDDQLWFMNDLIILNPFDDTLPRAGGADTDGDTMLITDNEIILNSAPVGMDMLYDEGQSGRVTANNWDERSKHFISTAVMSQVGRITNLASVYRDLSLHNGDPLMNDIYVMAFRFYQGWEIDKAKTGAEVKIPDHLATKAIPHFMIANKTHRRGSEKAKRAVKRLGVMDAINELISEGVVSEKAKPYHSNSPLGKLYDHVVAFINKFDVTIQTEDKTLLFMKSVNNGEAIRISEMVKVYEKQYCRDIRSIMNLYPMADDDIFKKARTEATQELYGKYQALLGALSNDECAVAYAAYNAAYSKKDGESKSYSFPWTCAFNGMLQLLHLNNNATRLVKLPDYKGTPESVIVSNSGMMFINDEPIKVVNYKPGVYEIIILEEARYIRVARDAVKGDAVAPSRYIHKRLHQFSVNGYYWHLNLKAQDVIDTIVANNNEFSVVGINNRTMIVADNKVLAYFNSADNALLSTVVNVKFNLFEHEELSYIPSRKTEKTVMLDQTYAMKNSFYLTAIPVSAVTEEELKELAEVTGSVVTEDFSDVEIREYYEEDNNVIYSSEASIVVLDDEIPPATIVDENTMVIEEILVADDIRPEVMAKLNLNASYWANKSLAKPAGVESYTVNIVNYTNLSAGSLVGTLTAFRGGKGYSFDVVVNAKGDGIEINSNAKASAQFCDWTLRVISYKAKELGMGYSA